MYKAGGRTFIKALYEGSSDLFPAHVQDEFARAVWRLRQSEAAGEWVWVDFWLAHSEGMLVLLDAAALRSWRQRADAEMMWASAAAMAGEAGGGWVVSGGPGERALG